MDVGKRIRARRKELGLSAEDVAADIGVSPATVYRYESSDIMNMKTDKLLPIAEALCTTPAFLMGWTNDPVDYNDGDLLASIPLTYMEACEGDAKRAFAMWQAAHKDCAPPFGLRIREWADPLVDAYERAEPPRREAACDVLRIPYVDPGKPAATPQMSDGRNRKVIMLPTANTLAIDDEEPTEQEMIIFDYPSAAGMPLYVEADYERIKFPHLAVPSKADFGVRIEGDSMEPEIHDGDIVWVYKTPEIGDGQIGIFQLSDGAVCKRARMHPSGRLIGLESINSKYETISGNRLIGVRCVGRVLRRFDPDAYKE